MCRISLRENREISCSPSRSITGWAAQGRPGPQILAKHSPRLS
jgi:hypothetical protein